MILVDSSVLIDFLKGSPGNHVRRLEGIIECGLPFGLCGLVYMEVLQGVKSKGDFETLRRYLDSYPQYGAKSRETYAAAAWMYFFLKSKGDAVRSAGDCLIAQIALDHDLFLLHNDRDFEKIGRHFPLKAWSGL